MAYQSLWLELIAFSPGQKPVIPNFMLWLPVTYDTDARSMLVCFGLFRSVAPDSHRAMLRVSTGPGTNSTPGTSRFAVSVGWSR